MKHKCVIWTQDVYILSIFILVLSEQSPQSGESLQLQ